MPLLGPWPRDVNQSNRSSSCSTSEAVDSHLRPFGHVGNAKPLLVIDQERMQNLGASSGEE